jgi:hypothetical protein
MKIREGAYYRTRGGYVMGPMARTSLKDMKYVWRIGGDTSPYSWTDEGYWHPGYSHRFDLISEVYVSDTPPVNREITDEQFWGNIKEQQRKATAILGAPQAKTLRDEFAGRVLTGMMADHTAPDKPPEFFADLAYKYANALMEAREK